MNFENVDKAIQIMARVNPEKFDMQDWQQSGEHYVALDEQALNLK